MGTSRKRFSTKTNTSFEEFIAERGDYIHWYNVDRISFPLRCLSPMKYRPEY
ncbi:IS3 family transposase [Paeniglutamicibacter gangotriensis]|uniref:IS3 family transposase n=1 Tax=Paeniglutamicibacter gangotriensis TaxID=254787 RepID=UPI000347680E